MNESETEGESGNTMLVSPSDALEEWRNPKIRGKTKDEWEEYYAPIRGKLGYAATLMVEKNGGAGTWKWAVGSIQSGRDRIQIGTSEVAWNGYEVVGWTIADNATGETIKSDSNNTWIPAQEVSIYDDLVKAPLPDLEPNEAMFSLGVVFAQRPEIKLDL